jgi:hypothetical protein
MEDVAEVAGVSTVLIAVHSQPLCLPSGVPASQHRSGTAPYHDSFRYGTVWYQVLARLEILRRRRGDDHR